MISYRKCCDALCPIENCDIREQGGCECVCRLKDLEKGLLRELNVHLSKIEQERILDDLAVCIKILKKYEV